MAECSKRYNIIKVVFRWRCKKYLSTAKTTHCTSAYFPNKTQSCITPSHCSLKYSILLFHLLCKWLGLKSLPRRRGAWRLLELNTCSRSINFLLFLPCQLNSPEIGEELQFIVDRFSLSLSLNASN
ncbi:hypothetical protein MANES_02G156300v8 [Manihot esculenta]|uniref:Uncharacterized protein n=2 Tax=Manihot esculenta TaxID=3983 RepID=A0ACB7I6P0_MANES|nr:hypothetical protein MANES_02G156300v8 [Manihot esculenta]KAG8660416.1 hypothetical protein MANES_02G156300v8 [Manihot esculenta]